MTFDPTLTISTIVGLGGLIFAVGKFYNKVNDSNTSITATIVELKSHQESSIAELKSHQEKSIADLKLNQDNAIRELRQYNDQSNQRMSDGIKTLADGLKEVHEDFVQNKVAEAKEQTIIVRVSSLENQIREIREWTRRP